MKYIIVSDIHGSLYHMLQILSLLEGRGWTIENGQLYHPHETLIVAGDVVDRGDVSVPTAHFLWGNDNGSVISLMGNHDIKVYRYFYENRNFNNPDWKPTEQGLLGNPELAEDLARYVRTLPYTFTGETFRVAHAYYDKSKQMCMYGPRTKLKDGETPGSLDARVQWWETEIPDKLTIFGHYHHSRGEWTDPENGSICVDTWEDGVFTYVVVDDYNGRVEVFEGNNFDSETLFPYFVERYV